MENQKVELKSLRKLHGKNADWDDFYRVCVGMANSHGGKIIVGIEDGLTQPPIGQVIPKTLIEDIYLKVSQNTQNVSISLPQIKSVKNGSEILEVNVNANLQTVASTSKGTYFIRVGTETQRVLPDDLTRLFSEKNSFVWELQTTNKIPWNEFDEKKVAEFNELIQESERVTEFVKRKKGIDLLEHYFFSKDGFLTNLGILWFGKRNRRAALLYPMTIQFVHFDENGREIRKRFWDDFYLNPFELIVSVLTDIPEWNEFIEIPDGMFRNRIPVYEKDIVRELLVNAIAHRVYTMRGDILIHYFPDRIEVVNPGLLPMGVSPKNILQKSIRRNEHLAKVLYDLKLMEKAGSGYDQIYQILLSNGKRPPIVEEFDDSVRVTVYGKNINSQCFKLIDLIQQKFDNLSQKEIISLGLVASYGSLSSVDLAEKLALFDINRLQEGWLGKLVEYQILMKNGKTKGMIYSINPVYEKGIGIKTKTSLKTIEPYRLEQLLIEDLKKYDGSSIGEIQSRIGNEIHIAKIRRQLEKMISVGKIKRTGLLKYTKYYVL